MIQTRHCKFCEHPKQSLKLGVTCGLTNKKPNFIDFCPSIEFTNNFKENYVFLEKELIIARKGKLIACLKFMLLVSLGMLIIFKSYHLLIEANTRSYERSGYHYFKLAMLVLFFGSTFITLGIISLHNYTKPLKRLQDEKKELDLILSKYENNQINVNI